MCGIVGVVSKRKNAFYAMHLDLFQEMLWVDAVRGPDSTGAFSVLNNSQVKVIKNEMSPEFLLGTKSWDKFRASSISTGHILVGHNRKATYGKITRENAHPFAEGNIILVHNGTVMGHKEMKETEVDSHAICHSINEKGHKETIEGINGSFALVWYDMRDKTLRLVRNDQRPLCIAENNDIIAFASEGYMLGWMLSRHNIKHEKIEQLAPMEVRAFEFGPFKEERETLVKKVTTTPAWDDDQWEWFGGRRRYKGTTTSVTTTTPPALPAPAKTNQYLATFMDKYNLGDEIVFMPHQMVEDTVLPGRWKITGIGYLPGRPILNRVTWLMPHGVEWEDGVDMAQEEKLIGKIRSMCTDSVGDLTVYLENAKSDVMLTCWNDEEISSFEWEHITDTFSCSRCHQPLDKQKNATTSILMTTKPSVRCVCHKCVERNIGEMPKEKADAIKQASDTSVQDSIGLC